MNRIPTPPPHPPPPSYPTPYSHPPSHSHPNSRSLPPPHPPPPPARPTIAASASRNPPAKTVPVPFVASASSVEPVLIIPTAIPFTRTNALKNASSMANPSATTAGAAGAAATAHFHSETASIASNLRTQSSFEARDEVPLKEPLARVATHDAASIPSISGPIPPLKPQGSIYQSISIPSPISTTGGTPLIPDTLSLESHSPRESDLPFRSSKVAKANSVTRKLNLPLPRKSAVSLPRPQSSKKPFHFKLPTPSKLRPLEMPQSPSQSDTQNDSPLSFSTPISNFRKPSSLEETQLRNNSNFQSHSLTDDLSQIDAKASTLDTISKSVSFPRTETSIAAKSNNYSKEEEKVDLTVPNSSTGHGIQPEMLQDASIRYESSTKQINTLTTLTKDSIHDSGKTSTNSVMHTTIEEFQTLSKTFSHEEIFSGQAKISAFPTSTNSKSAFDASVPSVVEYSSNTLDSVLPEGWTEVTDTSTGLTYYFNIFSNESTWERPSTNNSNSVVKSKPDVSMESKDSPESISINAGKQPELVGGDTVNSSFSDGEPLTKTVPSSKNDIGTLSTEREVTDVNPVALEPIKDIVPEEWTEVIDPSSGKTYFFNVLTEESTWELPAATVTKSGTGTGTTITQKISEEMSTLHDVTSSPVESTDVGQLEHVSKDSDKVHVVQGYEANVEYDGLVEQDESSRACSVFLPVSQLPEGWSELIDPSSGMSYFFNSVTNESRWERPVFIVPDSKSDMAEKSSEGILALPEDNQNTLDNVDPAESEINSLQNQLETVGSVDKEFNSSHVQAFGTNSNNDYPETSATVNFQADLIADEIQAHDEFPNDVIDSTTDLLPEGWSELIDTASGMTYFFNAVTGEATWERPEYHPADLIAKEHQDFTDNVEEVVVGSVSGGILEIPQESQNTLDNVDTAESEVNSLQNQLETVDSVDKKFNSSYVQAVGTSSNNDFTETPVIFNSQADLVTDKVQANDEFPNDVIDNTIDLLPEGWSELIDTASGMPYFFNAVTGEATWERPEYHPADPIAKEHQDFAENVEEEVLEQETIPSTIGDEFRNGMDSLLKSEDSVINGKKESIIDSRLNSLGLVLPIEWSEMIDEASGKRYFFNSLTNESSWEMPTFDTEQLHGNQEVTGGTLSGTSFYIQESAVVVTDDAILPSNSIATHTTDLGSSSDLPVGTVKVDIQSEPDKPASDSTQTELPQGWTEMVDTSSGLTFYYNRFTNEATWEFPTAEIVNHNTEENDEDNAQYSESLAHSHLQKTIEPTASLEEDSRKSISKSISDVDMPSKPILDFEGDVDDPNYEPIERAIDTVGLPDGWSEEIDPASGLPYFFNALTNESTWERPNFKVNEVDSNENTFFTAVNDDNLVASTHNTLEGDHGEQRETKSLTDEITISHTSIPEQGVHLAVDADTSKSDNNLSNQTYVQNESMDPALPEGWSEVTDPVSGLKYFFNVLTNEATWENPTLLCTVENSEVKQELHDKVLDKQIKSNPIDKCTEDEVLTSSKDVEVSASHECNLGQHREVEEEEFRVQSPGNGIEVSDELLLPMGWEEVLDPSSGKMYYFNAFTNEATWDKPSAVPTLPSEEYKNNLNGDNGFEVQNNSKTVNVSSYESENLRKEEICDTPKSIETDLPEEWTEQIDPTSGKRIFFNLQNNEVTWERPSSQLMDPEPMQKYTITGIDSDLIMDLKLQSPEHDKILPSKKGISQDSIGYQSMESPVETCLDQIDVLTNEISEYPEIKESDIVSGIDPSDFHNNSASYGNEANLLSEHTMVSTTTVNVDETTAIVNDFERIVDSTDEIGGGLSSELMNDDELPDPWVEILDASSGQSYFFNADTMETTWERPIDKKSRSSEESNVLSNDNGAELRGSLSSGQLSDQSVIEPCKIDDNLMLDEKTDTNESKNDINFSIQHSNNDTAEWSKVIDPDSGSAFYYNSMTDEVALENPEEILIQSKEIYQDNQLGQFVDHTSGKIDIVKVTKGDENNVLTEIVDEIEESNDFMSETVSMRVSTSDDPDEVTPNDLQSVAHGTPSTQIGDVFEEWVEAIDASTGLAYYFNETTGETSWERPENYSAQSTHSNDEICVPNLPVSIPTGWVKLLDSNSGMYYYYNEAQDISSWEPPTENLDSVSQIMQIPMVTQEGESEFEKPKVSSALNDADSEAMKGTEVTEVTPSEVPCGPLDSESISSAPNTKAAFLSTKGKETIGKIDVDETGDNLDLAEGWVQLNDDVTGKYYYFNQIDGTTSWDLPVKRNAETQEINLNDEFESTALSTVHAPSLEASMTNKARVMLPERKSLATFGFGGKLCVLRFSSNSSSLEVHKVCNLVPRHPVVNAENTKKKFGIKGPLNEADEESVSAYIVENAGLQSSELLWSLIEIASHAEGRLRSDEGVSDPSSPESSVIQLLLKNEIGNNAIEPSLFPERNKTDDIESLQRIETLLLHGKREEAVHEAISSCNFTMALLIASMCDRSTFQRATKKYAEKLTSRASPLFTLALLFSGQLEPPPDSALDRSGLVPTIWSDVSEELLQTWTQHLSAIISNRILGWDRIVLSLGDRLLELGDVHAAHCCFMVCGCPVTSLLNPSSRMSLVGCDHLIPHDVSLMSEEGIVSYNRSEAYEWAKRRGNPNACISSLLGFKLAYAMLLTDLGFIDEAESYIKSIRASWNSNESYNLNQLENRAPTVWTLAVNNEVIHFLTEFEERLTFHRISQLQKQSPQENFLSTVPKLVMHDMHSNNDISFLSAKSNQYESMRPGPAQLTVPYPVIPSNMGEGVIEEFQTSNFSDVQLSASPVSPKLKGRDSVQDNSRVNSNHNVSECVDENDNSMPSFGNPLIGKSSPPILIGADTKVSNMHRLRSDMNMPGIKEATLESESAAMTEDTEFLSPDGIGSYPTTSIEQNLGQPSKFPPNIRSQPQITSSTDLLTENTIRDNAVSVKTRVADQKVEKAPKSAPAVLQKIKEMQPQAPTSSQKRAWGLGNIRDRMTKWLNPEATSADLGLGMQAYYDEDKKVWVFPGEDPAEIAKPIGPPPKVLNQETKIEESQTMPTSDPLAAMMAPPPRSVSSIRRRPAAISTALPGVLSASGNNATPLAPALNTPKFLIFTPQNERTSTKDSDKEST